MLDEAEQKVLCLQKDTDGEQNGKLFGETLFDE
jgi:hypothetical protein